MNPPSARALVTPVILTYNEAPNLGRALESLTWAAEVLVVDSGSTDATEQIAREFKNVRWLTRPFDNHGTQWAFAIKAAGGKTPYVLALDADYQMPAAVVREIGDGFARGQYVGAMAGFDYQIRGRSLFGSVYPAKLVLFRPELVRVSQPGHTQEFHIDGPLYRFKSRLVHDDRKPLARFVSSQMEYSRLESIRLAGGARRWQDRLRGLGIMPLVVGIGAYLRAGGPLRGSASLRYAYERALFECLLALRVLNPDEASQSNRGNAPPEAPSAYTSQGEGPKR